MRAGGKSMPAHEFLTNFTVILAVMAVGALLETVVPMWPRSQQDGTAARRTSD